MTARIPQPGPGEPLSDRCCWCGAGRRDLLLANPPWRDYECKAGGPESTSEGSPQWWSGMLPMLYDRLCTRTHAEVAAVVTDMVTEREAPRMVFRRFTAVLSGQAGRVGAETATVSDWIPETPDAVLRRVLLASFDPETETERAVAALLADTRQEPVRA